MSEIKSLARQARALADTLDASGRARLMYELTRAVYDSEKFNGEGGGGLDGRDSTARHLFGEVTDAANQAMSQLARPS